MLFAVKLSENVTAQCSYANCCINKCGLQSDIDLRYKNIAFLLMQLIGSIELQGRVPQCTPTFSTGFVPELFYI